MKSTPISIMLALGVSCSGILNCGSSNTKVGSTTLPQISLPDTVFIYKSLCDYSGEELIINGEDGYAPICSRIQYLDFHSETSELVNSLADFYNCLLAFNAIAYDTSTLARYMTDDEDSENSNICDPAKFEQSFHDMDLSPLKLPKFRKSLNTLLTGLRNDCRNRKRTPPDTLLMSEIDNILITEYWKFADYESLYNPEELRFSKFIPDFDELHDKATSDTTIATAEMIYNRYLNAKTFDAKCILAMEFAQADYKCGGKHSEIVVAIMDELIRDGRYNPFLFEIWEFWRTRLQIDFFGGRSNDSPMHNLFYNSMKNIVAKAYLRHIESHPEDKNAIYCFSGLVLDGYITRNSECLFGNNALLDEMNLYRDCWNK